MTIILDDVGERKVQEELRRGRYVSPHDVVMHALELLSERRDVNPQTKRDPKVVDDVFGLWADRDEDGLAYQLRMRAEWDR